MSDGLYVLTKGGKPAIALISIKYLEEIMGGSSQLPANSHQQSAKYPIPAESRELKAEIHKPVSISKPQIIPKPNFEIPKIPSSPVQSEQISAISHQPSANTGNKAESRELKADSPAPEASYDVKPVINPTWRGEEPKTIQPSAISNQQSAVSGLPAHSRQPIADSPVSVVPSKPPINPWPIIPPRSTGGISSTESPQIIPPRAPSEQGIRDNSTIPPRAPSEQGIRDTSTVPPRQAPVSQPIQPSAVSHQQSANSGLPAESRQPIADNPASVAPIPPRMVAPPPPPPPSSLPNIPSSFQTVPVPINGGTQQSAISNQQSASSSIPADSRQPTAISSNPTPLPPPPVTTAPAPFSQSTPPPFSAPILVPEASSQKPVAPLSSDTIKFDQPPTTIPEPGETYTNQPLAVATQPSAISHQQSANIGIQAESRQPRAESSAPVATPPQTQASVQDLEI